MTEPVLNALKPFLAAAGAKARKLHGERQAGASGSPPGPIDLTAALLRETLNRLRGGQLDDNWWRQLLGAVEQAYVVPDFLKKPALQNWLQSKEVEDGIVEMARANVMGTTVDHQGAIREKLRRSYADLTGEAENRADGAIDVVVAVLIAGYCASIPPTQMALAGMVQEVHNAVVQSGERQEPQPGPDLITQQAHDEKVQSDLAAILEQRMLDFEEASRRVQHLQTQVETGGELAGATAETKAKVLYWAARLSAADENSLETAQRLRKGLANTETVAGFRVVIIDALVAANRNDEDEAIQLLRDVDDADARSVLFGLLVRFRDEECALAWYADVVPAEAPSHFTHAGWHNWALAKVKVGCWEEAALGLYVVQQTLGREPRLAYLAGVVNAALLLPKERRATLDGIPFHRRMSASVDPQAEKHRKRAIECFEYLASHPNASNDDLKKAIDDWHLWLGLMSPSPYESTRAQEEQIGRAHV